MKISSITEYILYFPLSIIVFLSKVLPIKSLYAIARFCGKAGYYLAGKRRRTANANLKAAFGERYDQAARDTIIKAVFNNLALNFIELLMMNRLDAEYCRQWIEVENFDYFQAAQKNNKGILFVTAHFGNWEIASIPATINGHAMVALGRRQKPQFWNDLINRHRRMTGRIIVDKGIAMREIIKELRKNGVVGILGDQSGRQGMEMNFFGRPIYMADGAFRIAARTGAIMIPAFNMRRGEKHHLVIEKPIMNGASASENEIEQAMLRYRDLLERYIGGNPEQWLWVNRRWRHTKARTVVLLTDGKAGHLRQAQAVAASIARQTKPVKVIELAVTFKNPRLRSLFTVAMLCCGRFIPLSCLRRVLTPDCYQKLENMYSDIVVCCGAATRGVALLLARENLSKTISIMKPAPFPARQFTLSVIPYHDSPRFGRNVFVTEGALNLITPEYLNEQAGQLRAAAGVKTDRPVIGLLIGGDSKEYRMAPEAIGALIEQVKKFADDHDARILLTTSRRTPPEIDRLLHAALDGYSRCGLKVFPNENNISSAVGGILGMSSMTVVTGESISMVSEAASSGNPVVVFDLLRKKADKRTRHEVFLNKLQARHRILRAKSGTLYDALQSCRRNPSRFKSLEEWKRLDVIIREKILK